MIDSGKPADEILSLVHYFAESAKSRIDHHFAGTSKNADARGYALVQDLLKVSTKSYAPASCSRAI